MILVYVTNSSIKNAKNIVRHLLKKKLIACANIFPVQTIYLNNGITEETEAVLIAKTIKVNYNQIKKEIEQIHPYTIPCILKIPVKANKKYEDWIKKQLK
ncbi:MAG: divalent-cation tolerance protein CutA [Candidatus Woesearchaeota archaeon]|jgi:periplasmic divalent cation tolerance protein